ncbi:hypothetical protein OK016_11360 [Vibrio chagasii]|nr:hypothetical protein [Vibrio chagasii]
MTCPQVDVRFAARLLKVLTLPTTRRRLRMQEEAAHSVFNNRASFGGSHHRGQSSGCTARHHNKAFGTVHLIVVW